MALTSDNFDEVWLAGLAKRVGIDPARHRAADIIAALSAYHEFEHHKLFVAVKNPQYKPENHANDLLDAEQLIYLADPRLHFLTADGGYLNRITQSPQKARIHLLKPKALTRDEVPALLRAILP